MNALAIRPGRAQDLPEVRRLLQHSARSYLHMGLDEISALLWQGTTAVAVDPQRERLVGFLAFQEEERCPTLPAHVADKVSLGAAAVSPVGTAARQLLIDLIEFAISRLAASRHGHLLFVITDQGWLLSNLREAGFVQYDEIWFYERTRRSVVAISQPAILRPAQESDLPCLARLDAATFDPLWHMGTAALRQLYCGCRFEAAYLELSQGQRSAGHQGAASPCADPVGYTALALPARTEQRSAQLVRLAVHPTVQGCGIGRQLLVASLRHAHEQGIHHMSLNTQGSNVPSQRLYESLQFRKRGHPVPVLIRPVSV